jgi:hypothetical protein
MDLTPRTATVTLPLPKGAGPGLRLRIVSDAAEVTQRNNVVMLEGGMITRAIRRWRWCCCPPAWKRGRPCGASTIWRASATWRRKCWAIRRCSAHPWARRWCSMVCRMP